MVLMMVMNFLFMTAQMKKFGIESADTKYLNGTFKVTTRSYTNIETGEITHRYYVERSVILLD